MQIFCVLLLIFVVFGDISADTIALFYALDNDLAVLKEGGGFRPVGVDVVGTRRIYRLQAAGHQILAVKMDSGCVETAISAQAILAKYRCDRAISIGPAGALTDRVATGFWFRADRVVAWQDGTQTADGFQLSEQSVRPLDEWPVDVLANIPKAALASGEVFVASREFGRKLGLTTGADLIDMNSFGLAAACRDHRVPLVILRVVSDGADENAGETFRKFAESYDGEGGRIATRMIRALPPNPDDPMSYEEIRRLME